MVNVVLDGSILPGMKRDTVLDRAGKLLKLDAKTIDGLLQGKSRVIKRNLDENKAKQYVKAIADAGIACHIEPDDRSEKTSGALEMAADAGSGENTDSICPKCGFELKAIQKRDLPEECPKCGIIFEKYTGEPFTGKNAPSDGSVDESPSVQTPVAFIEAPKGLRISAALGSLVVPGVIAGLCYPLVAAGLYLLNLDFLSEPLSAVAWEKEKLDHINTMLTLGTLIVSLPVAAFYFIVQPTSKGGTWAQRFLNINVVRADSEKDMNLLIWAIRALCQFSYILPLLLYITIIALLKDQLVKSDIRIETLIQVGTLIWMVFCIFLLISRRSRSFPDRFSGTRQIVKNGNGPQQTGVIWIIIVICLAISLGGVSFGRHLITPTPPIDEEAALASRNHRILQKVCEYQKQNYQQYGAYSEDPIELVSRFSNINSLKNMAYLKAADSGMLFIEVTEEGFLCALPASGSPDTYLVYTQDGEQGIMEGDYNVWERLKSKNRNQRMNNSQYQ